MYDQLKDHFDKLLSKYQCGFRKGFSTQHCLLAIIEKLRKSLDSWGESVLIAKLHVYGIKKESLNLLFSYLKKRKQRVRRNNETVSSSKYEKLLGVKIDHELNFNEHVSSLCNKASQKLNALS